MNKKQLKNIFSKVGIALCSTHNTVTTDIVGVEPDDKSWRIDNSKEIDLLDELEATMLRDSETCPLCGH